MKNIVFDLGGVLFARDRHKCSPQILEFFSFLRAPRMPRFWEEYDRGTSTFDEVVDELCRLTGRPREVCVGVMREAINLQEPVAATECLVGELKAAGYRLYVLSNMSREFIDYLRRFPVYALFDGEVVSCEELVVKPTSWQPVRLVSTASVSTRTMPGRRATRCAGCCSDARAAPRSRPALCGGDAPAVCSEWTVYTCF